MLERQPVWRQNRKARLKPADGTLALILALLMMCGLLTLFSATYYKAVDQGDALLEVKKQLIGVGLGAFLMFLTSRIPYSFWQKPRVVMLALKKGKGRPVVGRMPTTTPMLIKACTEIMAVMPAASRQP